MAQWEDLVTIGGMVSDYDGDNVSYRWLLGEEELASGTVSTTTMGTPVAIPDLKIIAAELGLGDHTLELFANDGVNLPSNSLATIQVIDTTAPSLNPLVSQTILWPPNHEMREIIMWANAADNTEKNYGVKS